MRCRQCDYPLWEIDARQCPECGTAFRPSEFDFVPGSVRFCCPKCEQTYYGTDQRGHLVPPEFACIECGEHLQMDRMVLRPAEGVDERQTAPDIAPWNDRKHIGRRKAMRSTFYRALVQPGRLARSLPDPPRVADSLKYAAVIAVALALISGLMMTVFMIIPFTMFPGGPGGGFGTFFVLPLVMMTTFAFVFLFLGQLFWACLAHLVLLISGPRAGGFGRTVESFCYATGAHALTIVPGCGAYIAWIWAAVSACVMLKERQGVSWLRAIVATATVPAIGLALLVAYVVAIATLISNAGTFSTGPIGTGSMSINTPVDDIRRVSSGLRRFASRNGTAPANALELLRDGDLNANDFLAVNSLTMPSESSPLGVRLDFFMSATPDELERLLRQAADATPHNIVAHRVGDYVFTYHGVNLSQPQHTHLWIVVRSLDPTIQQLGFDPSTTVVTAGRTTLIFEESEFDSRLDEQNSLRATYGLSPLPHPDNVRADSPAVAPD